MTQLPDPDSWQGRPHHITLGFTLPTSHQVPRAKGVRPLPKPARRHQAWASLAAGPQSLLVPAALVTGMTAPWPVPAPAGQPLSRDRTLGGPRIEALEDSCPLVGSWARGGHCRLEGDSFAV